MDELARFEAKFTKGASHLCWPWEAYASSIGYGQFENTLDTSNLAHRYALYLKSGPPPGPGYEACHTCDNRICVNPAHLYWGTRKDNVGDACIRGRNARGQAMTGSRFRDEDIPGIRERYASGVTSTILMNEYGVSRQAIYDLTSGRTYAHMGGPITPKKRIRSWR